MRKTVLFTIAWKKNLEINLAKKCKTKSEKLQSTAKKEIKYDINKKASHASEH